MTQMSMYLMGFLTVSALALSIWALVRSYPKKTAKTDEDPDVLESPYSSEKTGTLRHFTYRATEDVKAPGSFADWSELMIAMALTDGPKTLEFDNGGDVANELTIPAGTFDMMDVTWTCSTGGHSIFVPSMDLTTDPSENKAQRTVINLTDGAMFTNLATITGPLLIKCNNTSKPNVTLTNEGSRLVLQGGVCLVGADAAPVNDNPFVQFKALKVASMDIGQDCALVRGTGNSALVDVTANTAGTAFTVRVGNALIGQDEISTAVGVAMTIVVVGPLRSSTALTALTYPLRKTGARLALALGTVVGSDLTGLPKMLTGSGVPGSSFSTTDGVKLGDFYLDTSASPQKVYSAISGTTTLTWAILH